MLAAGYGTVSDFEIFFLITSSIGLVFSVYNVRTLSEDWKFLKEFERNRNSDAGYLLTKVALFNEAGRAFLQATFVYIAILQMRLPDPEADSQWNPDRVLTAIARWAFLVGAVWVTAKTAYTWYIRRQVQEMNGNGNYEIKTRP